MVGRLLLPCHLFLILASNLLMEMIPSFELEQVPVEPVHLPQPGDLCPKCGIGRLDYNGVLLLACEECGYVLGDGGGCT